MAVALAALSDAIASVLWILGGLLAATLAAAAGYRAGRVARPWDGRAEDPVRLLADASHEMKTPLAIIRSQCETILRKPRPAEEYVETLRAVLDAATRLSDLVGGLLKLARAESAEGAPVTEPIDLHEAAREALPRFEPMAAEKGIALSLEGQGPCPVAVARKDLDAVLENLLSNAIAYSDKAGSITIDVREKDGFARLWVRDEGTGIPEASLPHIFDRFYRAERSRSRKYGGTGLGLAIVRAIVTRAGGKVSATSRPGAGTIISVALPLKKLA